MEVVKRLASKVMRVNRVILKKFMRNYSKFYQEVKVKMIFEGKIVDMKQYMPKKLMPIVVFLEEVSLRV